MDSFQIFGLQMGLTFVVYALIAKWYIAPRLARLPQREALVPLLFSHCFRHLGLVFLLPVVTDPNLPREWAGPVAYGDLIAQGLALLSVIALRAQWGFALILVWVFNIFGAADLLYAYYKGVLLGLQEYKLGSTWYIVTFVSPALIITHYMIFARLLKRQPAPRV